MESTVFLFHPEHLADFSVILFSNKNGDLENKESCNWYWLDFYPTDLVQFAIKLLHLYVTYNTTTTMQFIELTITNPFPLLAMPSENVAGFLFICSLRFLWYSLSNVKAASPLPIAPVILRKTAFYYTNFIIIFINILWHCTSSASHCMPEERFYTQYQTFGKFTWPLNGSLWVFIKI